MIGKNRLLKVSTTPAPDGMMRKCVRFVKRRDKEVGRGEGEMIDGSGTGLNGL
jgi:hypothetical protein